MLNLQTKLDAFVQDVNREDGFTLRLFEKILGKLFSIIKWAGIPFILYLLVEVMEW